MMINALEECPAEQKGTINVVVSLQQQHVHIKKTSCDI